MATVSAIPLEELTRLASDFLTTQQGTWDHKAWKGLLSQIRQKGIALSEETQEKLGELLEVMKAYREAVSATEEFEKAMGSVLEESVAFIKRQRGIWGHGEWEDFLTTIQQNTHTWSAGMEAYLGRVLESLKVFYRLPAAAAGKKAAAAKAAAPVKEAAPAAPKNALRKAGPAKTRKKTATKKPS